MRFKIFLSVDHKKRQIQLFNRFRMALVTSSIRNAFFLHFREKCAKTYKISVNVNILPISFFILYQYEKVLQIKMIFQFIFERE